MTIAQRRFILKEVILRHPARECPHANKGVHGTTGVLYEDGEDPVVWCKYCFSENTGGIPNYSRILTKPRKCHGCGEDKKCIGFKYPKYMRISPVFLCLSCFRERRVVNADTV